MRLSQTSRLKLGTAPDSWGVWYADDPHQTPWRRFLDEVARAGYTWIELGPYGYLPTDAAQLAAELQARSLKVAGGSVHGVGGLHRRDDWRAALDKTRKVAELTHAVSGRHVVFVPSPGYRDDISGAFLEPAELDADGWRSLARASNELGKMTREEFGITLDYHAHADSHVETQEQIERFLDLTDSRYVWLCLDTGHVAYRAGDPVALIEKYPDRIGYVHLKQVDPRIARAAAEERIPFGQAVQRGVCVEPPHGVPAAESIIEALRKLDRDLFVVVEQDLYPCEFDVPLPIAIRTRDYLNSCGLGSAEEVRS